MALRSRSRATTVTSGPGRAPGSDGRTRTRTGRHARAHTRRHPPARERAVRHRQSSAEELRRRAEALFAERPGKGPELGKGPPCGGAGRVAEGHFAGAGAGGAGAAGAGGDVGACAAAAVDALDVGAGAGPVAGPEDGADVRPGVGPGVGPVAGVGSRVDSAGGGRRVPVGLALRERMPVWLQTRCGLERRGVLALTVLLVVAAAFAVQHFWVGRTEAVRAPEVVRAVQSYGAEEPTEGEASAAPAGAPSAVGTAAPEIVVDVGGKVREPGIHRLPAGSRVADALRAAGGVKPGASTDGLNRARFLVDGEQVIVGGPGAPSGQGSGGGPAGTVSGAAPAAPVSLTTATLEQLDTLPGVGPVLAQHIVDYRTQHGGFRSVDQLREVNGIGDRRFADLRNLVRP
ncbi:ComEA family DNA-binding protein [Streptomyces sp. ALI-76-A]|uniref:ComEA family DNA-binding protein n=1 Tax=Streptomyces sp. ALI-76-A TaxID=3025736 RepID=UPI00256EE618|nr:ComEA family DNA-binding protein [Streptomyces sp. ALI-76-A]MDL5201536.1 ComEA family DNA-binding protein [Streptomyces sp. ALI-76-A]